MRKNIILIGIAVLILLMGTAEATEFNVGIYFDNPTSRTAGFDELVDYGANGHNILIVKDLETGDVLPEFCVTGASENWEKILNTSSSPVQFYPNSIDLYNLTSNPNLWGGWLGLGVINAPMFLKYISKIPITVDNFLVEVKAWSGYGADGSQSRGIYFDYVDMNHTYLVRVNGDRSFVLEDLSTNTILSAGNFYGDNYNPNINTIVEISNLTDTDMHVKAYCTISPAPYERLFFNGTLPRQNNSAPESPPEEPPNEPNVTIIYSNTTTRTVTDKGITNYYTNTTNVYQNITYVNQTYVYQNESENTSSTPNIQYGGTIGALDVFEVFFGVVVAALIIGGIIAGVCIVIVCYYVISKSRLKR